MDREKFVERFGDDVVVVLSGGSDVVTPGTEAEQRLPFREAVAEITGPGSTRLVLEAELVEEARQMVKNNKKFRHDREAFAPEATPWLWEALGGGETRLRPEGYPPFNPRLPESIGGEAPEDSEVPQVYTDIARRGARCPGTSTGRLSSRYCAAPSSGA